MKIDLTCPVELWHFDLPTAGDASVRLQLFNLSDKEVVSVQAAFLCFDQDGHQYARQAERLSGLHGVSHNAFELLYQVAEADKAARIDFVIEKVWFFDGTVWRRGEAAMTEYDDNRLHRGRELDMLRHLAGQDAVGYPSRQEEAWLCLCGRPNPLDSTVCARCDRDAEVIFAQFSRVHVMEKVKQAEEEREAKSRLAREEAGRRQVLREERDAKAKKKKKRLIIAATTVVLLAGSGYLVVDKGIPAVRYYLAERKLHDADFEGAKADFLALGSYRDAPDMALQSDYNRAMKLMETETHTALKAAETLFNSLGDFQEAKHEAKMAVYRQAKLFEVSQQYADAAKTYLSLGDFSDSADKEQRMRYLDAGQLMDKLLYDQAYSIYLSLGDYQDSVSLAQACLEIPADNAVQLREFATAIALYEKLSDKTAAALKINSARYQWGEDLLAAGQFDQAAEQFLACGDYLDAYRKAAQCLYEPAKALMEQGDYQQAKDKLDRIPAYQDAADLARECAYQLALKAAADKDYRVAIKLLAQAGPGEKARSLMMMSHYQLALTLEKDDKVDDALNHFALAGDYEDARERALALGYQKAVSLANAHDYQAAASAFAKLGDYKNARQERISAQYSLAIDYLDKGQPDKAIPLFEAVKDHAQAGDYLNKARVAWGKQLIEQGNPASAADVLLEASGFEEADSLYKQTQYDRAKAALSEERLHDAALLFKEAADHEDAAEQEKAILYTLAEREESANKLAEAARLFAALGDYQDAAERAEKNSSAYFENAYQTAKTAMNKRDHQKAVDALAPLDRKNPPEKYRDIENLYQSAVYALANELYDKDEPYKALPYFCSIADYRDVSSKLARTSYRVLGEWISSKGLKMSFREDGSCTIDGRELFFMAKGFQLKTGARAGELDDLYQVVKSTDDVLNLRHVKTQRVYKMTKEAP